MKTTASDGEEPSQWGIYHREWEYAREVGDPCLGVVEATSKSEAESAAQRQGLRGPTGLWAHPLQRGCK